MRVIDLTAELANLKVFWLSKDQSTSHRERKKEENVDRRGGGKIMLRSGQGWTLMVSMMVSFCAVLFPTRCLG